MRGPYWFQLLKGANVLTVISILTSTLSGTVCSPVSHFLSDAIHTSKRVERSKTHLNPSTSPSAHRLTLGEPFRDKITTQSTGSADQGYLDDSLNQTMAGTNCSLQADVSIFTCPADCRCKTERQGMSVSCVSPDTLQGLPAFSKDDARAVLKLEIQGQPRLLFIRKNDLKYFACLESLTIENCGLNDLQSIAFKGLVHLETLNLRHNQLREFPEELIKTLELRNLLIQGNPLACTCKNLWLRAVDITTNGSNITCLEKDAKGRFVLELQMSQYKCERCGIPQIRNISTADVSKITNEFSVHFVIAGCPKPQIHVLRDNYHLLRHDSSQFRISYSKSESNDHVQVGTISIVNHIGARDKPYILSAVNSEGQANQTFSLPKLWTEDNFSATTLRAHTSENLGSKMQVIIPVVGVLILLLISALFIIYLCQKARHRSHAKQRCKKTLLDKKYNEFQEEMPLTGLQLVDNPNYNLSKKKQVNSTCPKKVRLQTILLMRVIGEGAFGRVFLGTCAHLIQKNEFTIVAVKTLKGGSSDVLKRDFEREAEMLATIEHINIVTFYGVCTESEQWMMIFEFMENGDLNNYLRMHGPDAAMLKVADSSQTDEGQLIQEQLMKIVTQIANAMEYLASQHFVHRDLATRNCLVGCDLVVKLGDFGMSRDVYTTDYYRVEGMAMLPVRWMPPESIMYRTFTTESDVWSFGVTLWEVFTYGKQPWFEYSNSEVIEHIKNSRTLKRPPKTCTDGVYKIMLGCWKPNPQDRLTMKDITKLLHEEISGDPVYIDIIA